MITSLLNFIYLLEFFKVIFIVYTICFGAEVIYVIYMEASFMSKLKHLEGLSFN